MDPFLSPWGLQNPHPWQMSFQYDDNLVPLPRLQEVNSMINKRLKDALFTDQWSELFMDALGPFNFVLVMTSLTLPTSWSQIPGPSSALTPHEGTVGLTGGL